MADNTLQTGSDTIATDDIAALSAKVQRVKVGYGDDGSYTDASATNPLPVTPGVNGGALVTTTGAIGAGATGTVGPLTVGTLGNASFIIRNTTAGSAWAGAPVVVFEQSGDSTSWSPLPVVRSDTGQAGSTFTLGIGFANQELVFDCALEGISYIRARVTTGPTTNGLTIDIAAGGMPFPQCNTVLAVPLDGHKTSYIAANGGAAQSVGLGTTGPWFQLDNTGTNKLLRITRFRVEMTIATAALVTFRLDRYTQAAAAGTDSGAAGVTSYDSADPTSSVGVKLYSTVPAGTLGSSNWHTVRRLWVGLATAAGAPYVSEWTWGRGSPMKALVIRNNQAFEVSWIAAPGTAVSVHVEAEWTEEPA